MTGLSVQTFFIVLLATYYVDCGGGFSEKNGIDKGKAINTPRRGNERLNIDLNYERYADSTGKTFVRVYQTVFELPIKSTDTIENFLQERYDADSSKHKVGSKNTKISYQNGDTVVISKPVTIFGSKDAAGLIVNRETHWVSVGFVERQLYYMYTYGKAKRRNDRHAAIQSFLIEETFARQLLNPERLTTENFARLNSLDVNVDLIAPNQLGLKGDSIDKLNAGILPDSLISYVVKYDSSFNYPDHVGKVRPITDLADIYFSYDGLARFFGGESQTNNVA